MYNIPTKTHINEPLDTRCKSFFRIGGITMKRENDFLECYSKVFAPNGEIKECGRDVCINLILKCLKLDESGVDYGNVGTGFLNIDAVKQLVAKKFPAIIFREEYVRKLNGEYAGVLPENATHPIVSFYFLTSCGLLPKDEAKFNDETAPFYTKLTKLVENAILVRDYL